MKSDLPKGLHRVCGMPMVQQIGSAMKLAGIETPIVVIGFGGEAMISTLGEGYSFAWQHEQNGTGHAAKMAMEALRATGASHVIIAPGDTPLLASKVFDELYSVAVERSAQCVVSVAALDDPTGYGRVISDYKGPLKIVEHKDATPEERDCKFVNAAIYCFEVNALEKFLPLLASNNAQGEEYLTDIVGMIREDDGLVVAYDPNDPNILLGVNDRWQLAQASQLLQEKILREHAENGVTIIDPTSTYIEVSVKIGVDTVIEPGTILEGDTVIGSKCHIGPNTKIKRSKIGNGSTILMSHLERAVVGENCRCGPFANLRPHAVLGENVKIGNFVEVKNARLGDSVSASHLSYLGDGEVGARSNIGAGTIFCNYDGYLKHHTKIGEEVFVGSNSTLVAPIEIGSGAIIAAGSVITSNVPENALALGRARQEVKEGWAQSWRQRKIAEKERRSSA
jgi:bifunctional UDP-N-acetylglucosamine pyrophosphorylase/glucosamine-1-phosphate N-acetyltransferase